ncbi:MAG: cbb3-type cytochrome c oxidase subunit I [Fimbriimonadales bacterium]|nr:cbb3-type cytochrome c oxidase subunit I [Fimbriimonadales bacterium]
MSIRGGLRFILLSEIVFPFVLLILGVLLGLLQVLQRAGIIKSTSYLGIEYYQGLTLHGAINAIVFTTFIIVAFSNAMVMFSLKRSLKPGVQWVSWLLMVGGTLMAAYAMLTGKANVLYTFYPPLIAHWTFYVGVVLLVVGSLVPFFFDWIPNYIAWRRENPTGRFPLPVLGVFVTFILWFIMVIPVAIEILFQLLPLSLGWVEEINPLLARTLFWFFGHPLVYFWLLPAYIMLYSILPNLVGGKLYSDPAARLALLLFLVFSVPVGLHHQYTEGGLSAGWKLWHAFLTFMVALPSFITAFTVAASLEHGARQRGGKGLFAWWAKLPYFSREGDQWLFSYFIAGLLLFLFGGITGIVNASYNLNLAVHNTSWVVGHFHTTVGGLVTLAFLGISLYMMAKLRGVEVKAKGLAVAAPYLWLIGMMVFEVAMSVAAFYGFPRRTAAGASYIDPASPLYHPEWYFWAHLSAGGGAIAVLGFVAYLVSFLGTLFARPVREPVVEFPMAEALHDEPIPVLSNLRPWLTVSILLIAFSYTYPIYESMTKGITAKSPAYGDRLPVPLKQTQTEASAEIPR